MPRLTDLRFERILNRAGWPMTRIGEAEQIGRTVAVAGIRGHIQREGGRACVRATFRLSAERASVEPAIRLSYCRIGETMSSAGSRTPLRAATEPRVPRCGSTQGAGLRTST